MATSTVTQSCNVDTLSWNSNDVLVINNGATVTVNTDQNKGWQYVTINNGTLRIENDSTIVPITFRMVRDSTGASAITPTSGLGKLEVAGGWIQIGVGNGLPGQSFTLPYHNYVSGLWVETAPGSDEYIPWQTWR